MDSIEELQQRIKDLEQALAESNKAFTEAASLWQNATHDHREEVKELNARISVLQKDSDELNAAKRAMMNMFTGRKLFPNT